MWMICSLVRGAGSPCRRRRRSAGRCGRCGRWPSSAAPTTRRARAVGEQGGGAAVGLVDEAAQHVGADHEHVARSGRPRPGRRPATSADRKPVQAAPTSIAPALVRAEVVRHQRRARWAAARRRRRVATSTRSTSSAADARPRRARARPAAVARSCSRSPSRHVAALVHARAVDDPLLGHAGALGDRRVRDDPLRHRHRHGRQGGRAQMAVPRHGGRRHRRCGVGGGGFAHGRPRVRQTAGLRTGGLHRQGTCLHKVRQHAAGAGLDESVTPRSSQRAHHVGPADRLGEGARRAGSGTSSNGARGHAGHHGHARLARTRSRSTTARGTARRPAPSAASGTRPPPAGAWRARCARAAAPRRGRARQRARQHELVGRVVVGDRSSFAAATSAIGVAVVLTRADGGHAAVAGLLGRLLHEAAAGGDEPQAVVGARARRRRPAR